VFPTFFLIVVVTP